MEFLPEEGLKKFPLLESQMLVVGLVVVVVGVLEGRSPGPDPAQRERSGCKEVQKEKKKLSVEYGGLKEDSVLVRDKLSFRPHTKLLSSFGPGICLAFLFLSLNSLFLLPKLYTFLTFLQLFTIFKLHFIFPRYLFLIFAKNFSSNFLISENNHRNHQVENPNFLSNN